MQTSWSIIMSMFFKEGSQVSDYQNTAFFQNGEASKASIFDNPPPSETQVAYDLFNADSPPKEQERSIITQLELLERKADFSQTPAPADPRFASKRDLLESQESKDSRMTFGAKLHNTLRDSRAAAENRPGEGQKEGSKIKPLARGKPNEPTSNFSLSLRQPPNVKEPDSMPVKFDELKALPRPAFEAPSNSSSSSFSLDFQEIRQRNQMEVKPIAKQLTSLRISNEREVKDGRSESARSEKISEGFSLDSRFEEKEPQKERKFGFTLRRSRVAEEGKDNKPQPLTARTTTSPLNNASLSITPPQAKPEAKLTKNEEKPPITEEDMVTPFKMKLKEAPKEVPPTERILVISNVKKVENERVILNRLQQLRPLKESGRTQAQPSDKDNLKSIDNSAVQTNFGVDPSIEKEPSVRSDCNEQSKKRQSIGLKEQLKKLTSRPTEKVELKSIAFNKSFKLKTRPNDEKHAKEQASIPKQPSEVVPSFSLKPENQAKTSSKMFLREERVEREREAGSESFRGKFSRYMTAMMELQQESDSLRQRAIQARSSYRDLAILNDTLNRTIDDILNKK